MAFFTDFLFPLAVFLAAPVANRGQIGKVRCQIAIELALQPGRFLATGSVPVAAAVGLCGGGRVFLVFWLFYGFIPCFLPGMDGRAVTANMSGDLFAVMRFDHRFVDLLGPVILCKGAESA